MENSKNVIENEKDDNVIDSEELQSVGDETTRVEYTAEDENNTIEDDIANDDNSAPLETKSSDTSAQVQRLTRLPIARVKNIIKFDDDVTATSQESTFLITKATELFIEDFVKEVYQCTLASKKKTISKRDVDTAIYSRDCFIFLDGALD